MHRPISLARSWLHTNSFSALPTTALELGFLLMCGPYSPAHSPSLLRVPLLGLLLVGWAICNYGLSTFSEDPWTEI